MFLRLVLYLVDSLMSECAQMDYEMSGLCSDHSQAVGKCVEALVNYTYALENLQHKLYVVSTSFPGRWRVLLRDVSRGQTVRFVF